MSWTTYFNPTPNPSVFDPAVTYEVLNSYDQNQVNAFIDTVLAKLNKEVKLIDSRVSYDLSTIKLSIAQSWTSLPNVDKFNEIVKQGETLLTQQKNNTLTTDNINSFYQKYYFRQPTQQEIAAAQANPYGLGDSTKYQLKSQAINSLANYGLVNKKDYEGLSTDQQVAKLESFVSDINQIRDAANKANNNVIDSDKVNLNPIGAINALVQLKDQGILKLNDDNTYSYQSGKGVDDLATIDNGAWLTSYQKLEKQWRDSGSTQPFSTYLSQQQAFRAENERVRMSATSDYALDLANTLDVQLADKIAQEVGSPEQKLQEIQSKIDKLKTDAYKQAYNQLSIYQTKEQQQKDINSMLGDGLSSLTQELSQDFGIKSDVFKTSALNSSATYSWQKWFNDELAKRYDPNSSSNRIKSVLGEATVEEIGLASSFMNDFLRKRFDASKSLAEFTSYINPDEPTQLLEKESTALWNQYSTDNYYSLLGNITDPNSNLGNFWNLLQSSWKEGVGFDANYYKNQQVVDSNNKKKSIEQLWVDMRNIHQIAMDKNTTDLKPGDFDSTMRSALGVTTDAELTNRINEYRAWWNRAFEYGSNIDDLDQFTKMHYNVYKQDLASSNPSRLVVPADGAVLRVNSPDAIKDSDKEKIQSMAEKLAYEATNYINQIQYGEFMTPEEYVKTLMGNSDMSAMFKGTALDGSSETDILKEFNNEFVGVVSSYAGEQIRNNIRMLLEQNQAPNQELLGVEYIERTKEQALSTIRNIIKNQSTGSSVLANNIKAPAPGESLSAWFRNLGLEIVPGDTWEKFKATNNISNDISFEEWEKYYSYQSNGKGGTLGQDFWNQWSQANGVNMQTVNGRINLAVTNPGTAWKTWGNNIVNSVAQNNSSIISALDGASVEVKKDELNKAWYSSTNPYTKIIDDWNKAARNPSNKIASITTTSAWKWAKDNKVDPSGAWTQYVNEKRQTNSKFAKNAAGDDMSFEDWAASAKSYEVDNFWKASNSYWLGYLVDTGIAKPSSTPSSLNIKTWKEWADENNVELSTISTYSDGAAIPSQFLELHYANLGGKSRIDEEYLNIYFPEFQQLEQKENSTSFDSPFDLTAFGLDSMSTDPDSMMQDFDRFDPFKAISSDFGFDITNPGSVDTFDSKNTVDIKGDMNFETGINTLTKKKTNTQYVADFDMGFGDFGGASFGF